MTAILPEPGTARARGGADRGPSRRPAPELRLVEPSPRPGARTRGRAVAVLLLVSMAAALLGLVASHVALTQGQFRLERLRERAAAEQARYERLRLHVAELESPARIVAAAQERLGMVPPPGVTYLSPVGPVSGVEEEGEPGREAAGDDWPAVKRQLASRP